MFQYVRNLLQFLRNGSDMYESCSIREYDEILRKMTTLKRQIGEQNVEIDLLKTRMVNLEKGQSAGPLSKIDRKLNKFSLRR